MFVKNHLDLKTSKPLIFTTAPCYLYFRSEINFPPTFQKITQNLTFIHIPSQLLFVIKNHRLLPSKTLTPPPLKPSRNPHKLIKEAPHHPIPTIFTFSITKVKPLPHKDTLTIVNVLLKYHTPKNLKHSHSLLLLYNFLRVYIFLLESRKCKWVWLYFFILA